MGTLFPRLLRIGLGFVGAVVCVGQPLVAATDGMGTQDNATLVVGNAYGVPGLVLWLAADSGVKMDKDKSVSSLTDKTGNFVLTASDPDQQPTCVLQGPNGKPVLHFSPDQSLYSEDDFGTELDHAMTIIVVSKTDAVRTSLQYPLYLGQNRTPHANRALAYYEGKQLFDGQWVGFVGPPVVRNSFVAIGVTVNTTLTQATFYQNGALMMKSGLSDKDGGATFANLSHGVTLGAAADPCRGWLGDIAEALVFNRELSPNEMQIIWSSLAGKYGLQQTNLTSVSR